MNIVGIIPARGGSKGIPRKNIKLLAGKPLVAHTIEAALKSQLINKVVVSTEDSEIAEISRKYGAEVINRPMELAQDTTKTPPVIMHVIDELEKTGYSADIIVTLQSPCPLRDEKLIDAALNQLIHSDKDSIFTGFPSGVTMALWKRTNDKKFVSLYDYHLRPRRQETELHEPIFIENGALYAIKRASFDKCHDILGNNVDIFIMDRSQISHIDIDKLEDFGKAETFLLNK
jgi:N-acylneuraminate cytidylyltransferase